MLLFGWYWSSIKSEYNIKTNFSEANVIIRTSYVIKDFECSDSDIVCDSLDVAGSVLSAVSLVLGNIPATKHLTLVTGSFMVGCRSVRYYSKKYCTFGVIVLLRVKDLSNS